MSKKLPQPGEFWRFSNRIYLITAVEDDCVFNVDYETISRSYCEVIVDGVSLFTGGFLEHVPGFGTPLWNLLNEEED